MTGTRPGIRADGGRRSAGRRGRRAAARAALAVLLAGVAALVASPASAVAPPLSSPSIVAHFDLAAGQQPENITLLPDGSPVVTFSFARQVARIDRSGGAHILATFPAPPAGSAPPITGAPVVTGVVRADNGTLYVNYAAGSPGLTGVWALRPGHRPHRIAALPAGGFPNGLALDARHGVLYATDSVPGRIWRVPLAGGHPRVWASGKLLAAVSLVGANGIKVRGEAVWLTNTDQATLLRIPVTSKGTAGPIRTVATGLPGVDDFAFTGRGPNVLAALNVPNEVALVRPNGSHTIVLTGADGLQNPTTVAVRDSRVLVPSAAYFTRTDPNLLRARLDR